VPHARHLLGVLVMDAYDLLILGEVKIPLDGIGMLLPRKPEGGQGVLRIMMV